MIPRVIGLDLSLTATGIALTSGTHTIRATTQGLARLREITRSVTDWAICGGPAALAVVEGPAYSRALGAGHHEAAGLWWMVRSALDDLGVPVAVAPPTTLKKYATGKGNATKPDMRMALYQRTETDLRDDNQVDAWWLRALGLDHLGHAVVELPAVHRQALDKVAWPIAAVS